MAVSVQACAPVSVSETLAGAPGVVDLWYWLYEPTSEAALAAACEGVITNDERSRYSGFRFERDRRLFLATRLLVRRVLSRYSGVAPGAWRFEAQSSGKPHVSHPDISPKLHFNLANTPGLVVCGVSAAHELLGVDAERIDRRVDFEGVARRCFSPSETDALGGSPPDELARRFFEYWTLKESYVKALGVGLAHSLAEFSFTIGERDIDIAFHRQISDAHSWRFALLDASPVHVMALGANTGGAALSLRATHINALGV
jgi:4'-phosphopantetheinyl transferase